MPTPVTEPGFADPAAAMLHFERRLLLETDCDDVHESLKAGADFVLVDVRGPQAFARGHVPGAINIPLGQLEKRMGELPKDRVILTA